MKKLIMLPPLSFTEALSASVNKIFQVKGRSRRSEFWWTKLVVFLAGFVLTPIASFILEIITIPLNIRRLHDTGRSGWWYVILIILEALLVVFFIIDYIMLIVGLSTGSSHHPSGNNIPFVLLSFIAKYVVWVILVNVYQIVLLIFQCLDSEQETNKYGESPKYKILEEENEEM
ncbi:MAG: DUF805 domain-containing protein [Bacteroides sp.]|nr:DUF805 domain-containing protein [Roseburia sp.]MCM1346030.1 DUF805 domain-containing protein [Bacteroides sp.]MCM1420191.1 DUF805 domain-containing protein [Bacteroides sp.]